MAFKETVKKLLKPREVEDIDDEKTTDPYLRYLRRENRRINEKYERQKLETKIKGEAKKITRENVYGVKKMPKQNPYTKSKRYPTIFRKEEQISQKNPNNILNAGNVFGTELSPIKKEEKTKKKGFFNGGGFF